jgi:hypothetical protein
MLLYLSICPFIIFHVVITFSCAFFSTVLLIYFNNLSGNHVTLLNRIVLLHFTDFQRVLFKPIRDFT